MVSIQRSSQSGLKTASLKDIKVFIDNLSKNTKNQYHLIRYQVYSPKKLNYQTTSGVLLTSDTDRVTTILGTFKNDTENILLELKLPKSVNFNIKNGKFNLLNTPNELYQTPEQFWLQYNKLWLDKVIQRNDKIILATFPEQQNLFKFNRKLGIDELTGFGREYNYLLKHGYQFDATNMQMIKGL